MTMFLTDILGRTRPLKQFVENMYGLTSEPLFKISVNPALLAKGPKHLGTPYVLVQQFLIPEKPWNSISMDFIEHLSNSLGHTALLVVVD